jgi:hypothetical protein
MSPVSSWLTRRGLLRTLAVVGATGLFLLAVVGFSRPAPADDAGTPGHAGTDLGVEGAGDVASPIFGVKIPDGYRQWELIAVSQGASELKGIVGNGTAMKAYRDKKLPFPDGSILVKLSWKREPLDGFDGDFVPGAATMVQVMVKDSKKYASTGGWGFGRFIDGKPTDEGQHRTCFACHSSTTKVKDQDFVFTRFAR